MAKYADAAPKVLEYLEQGFTNRDAAEKAGISEAIFYRWIDEKIEFLESTKRARAIGDRRAVQDVEATLLSLAKGYEYEDVRTEYGSEYNPQTGKHEPVIKKQVRTKRTVQANTEAIKFFLTNKAPEEWKNRQDTQLSGDLLQKFQSVGKVHENGGEVPTSEDEIPD